MSPTSELLRALNDHTIVLLFGLLLARTLPLVMFTPFLGGTSVPSQMKLGLSVGISFLIYPFVRNLLPTLATYSTVAILLLLVKEALLGFILGFVNSLAFQAMTTAGRMIDTFRGASMSEVIAPGSKQQSTETGNFYNQLYLTLFVTLGGPALFLAAYFDSYTRIPILELMVPGFKNFELGNYLIKLTSEVLVISSIIAIPIGAVTFITDLVFGILNRVAPQLNAYFMSLPAKAILGVLIVFISLRPIASRMEGYMVWALNAVYDVIALMGGTPT